MRTWECNLKWWIFSVYFFITFEVSKNLREIKLLVIKWANLFVYTGKKEDLCIFYLQKSFIYWWFRSRTLRCTNFNFSITAPLKYKRYYWDLNLFDEIVLILHIVIYICHRKTLRKRKLPVSTIVCLVYFYISFMQYENGQDFLDIQYSSTNSSY